MRLLIPVGLLAVAVIGYTIYWYQLADATEWSTDSFAAATHVAAAANIQLRLVRIVCTLRGPRRIFLAEVHLGALPARSLWLDLALDALRATATVLALELPALSDPRLAQRVLQTPVLPPRKGAAG